MTVLISEETWGPEASLMPSSHSPPTHAGGLQLEEGAPGGGQGTPCPRRLVWGQSQGFNPPPTPPPEAISCASVSLACATRTLTATMSQSSCAGQ